MMGFGMMGLGRERSGGEMRPNSWKCINREFGDGDSTAGIQGRL